MIEILSRKEVAEWKETGTPALHPNALATIEALAEALKVLDFKIDVDEIEDKPIRKVSVHLNYSYRPDFGEDELVLLREKGWIK